MSASDLRWPILNLPVGSMLSCLKYFANQVEILVLFILIDVLRETDRLWQFRGNSSCSSGSRSENAIDLKNLDCVAVMCCMWKEEGKENQASCRRRVEAFGSLAAHRSTRTRTQGNVGRSLSPVEKS